MNEIRVVVACHGGDGPLLVPLTILCSPRDYKYGLHYERAIEAAREERYDSPFVVFDERDGPSWLFKKLFS